MKEIVVKMDDKLYEQIFSDAEVMIYKGMRSGKTLLATLLRAIRSGKVLPKGHGELKDTTTIIDKLTDTDIYLTDSDWKELGKAIGSAETLVEADEEGDNR